jgi:hypothetical protein
LTRELGTYKVHIQTMAQLPAVPSAIMLHLWADTAESVQQKQTGTSNV